MSSDTQRRKKKDKLHKLEDMSINQLIDMLGKKYRAKSIRSVLRKRIQAMNVLLPDDQKIELSERNKALPLSQLQKMYKE